MSSDYQPISAGKKSGMSTRSLIIILLVAFIGGCIATGWAIARFNLMGGASAALTAEKAAPADKIPDPVKALDERILADGSVAPEKPELTEQIISDPSLEAALSRRVAELENRLSRINVQAQAASGNAGRAEGLLIAFAARRALERGSPLGYIEEQLKLRFGQAQPNAVATIIAASKKPVTMDQLRAGLEELSADSLGQDPAENWWTRTQRELSEVFVLRREDTPSPAPNQRLERARRYVDSGRVETALVEIRKLPNQDAAQEWTELADRFVKARQALDFIETAAILEPRELRTGEGEQIRQPSPLSGE